MGVRRALTWWLFTAVNLLLLLSTYLFGGYHYLAAKDPTLISFVILGVFGGINVLSGAAVFGGSSPALLRIVAELRGSLMALGLMGTIIGFIMMLASFADVNVEDVVMLKETIKRMALGMSAAVHTTLLGIATTLLAIPLILSMDDEQV